MATDLAGVTVASDRGGRADGRASLADRPLAPDRRGARLVCPADPGARASRCCGRCSPGGLRPFFETLTTPEVRRAFGLTLGITALATVVNTVFGVGARDGAGPAAILGAVHLSTAIVDLPFAVSPVVAGLMLIVLYGPRAGWAAGWSRGASASSTLSRA